MLLFFNGFYGVFFAGCSVWY